MRAVTTGTRGACRTAASTVRPRSPRAARGLFLSPAPLLALALFAAGCGPGGPAVPNTRLAHDLTAARQAFNADYGKVRVVLVLSPT